MYVDNLPDKLKRRVVAITSYFQKSGAGPARIFAGRLRHSRAYDIAMRLPLLLWCGFLGISAANDLMAYAAGAADAPPGLYAVNIAMRLSLTGFFVVLLASSCCAARRSTRRRASSRACRRSSAHS